MKYFAPLLIALFILQGCSNEESTAENQVEVENDITPSIEDILTNRWVYKERVNAEGTKRLEFGDESSQRIIRFEANGHFMIYDSITNERIVEKGVPRIAKKSAGQWETKGMTLILSHIEDDTIRVEELVIEKLENGQLVTATSNRGRVTYYALD